MAECLETIPAGSALGYDSALRPFDLLLDLAVLAAGHRPVPVAVDAATRWRQRVEIARERGAGYWVEEPAPSKEAAGLPRVEVPALPPPPRGGHILDPQEVRRSCEALSVVRQGGEGSTGRPIPESAPKTKLARRVEALGSHLPQLRGRRDRRIGLLGEALDSASGRLLAAWSLTTGAALVLEPIAETGRGTADSRAGSVEWARPHLLATDLGLVTTLRRRWSEEPRRGRKARLERILVTTAAPIEAVERAFWEERGVAIEAVDPAPSWLGNR